MVTWGLQFLASRRCFIYVWFLVSRILSSVLNRLDLVVPFLQVSNVRVFLSAENNANDCAQKIVTSYHYHLCGALRVILLVDMSFLKKRI